jgi:phospholipid/cholesterol/gamma-HCH transport system permease protein
MLISMPLLIAESAAFGIFASWVVGTGPFGVNGAYWLNQMDKHTDGTDVSIALIKGLFFGVLIVVISCHQGLKSEQGAVGVGRGTTRAMVFSCLAILVVNFLLTMGLNLIFPARASG